MQRTGMQIAVAQYSIARSSGAPTPISATFAKPQVPYEDSKCWEQGIVRFRKTLLNGSKPPSVQNIDLFLRNKDRLDGAISACKALQAKADKRYDGKLGKLLGVLTVVRDVADPLLQYAPESISVAWSAISLLIGIGTQDMENCEKISEACETIATIILNCRLYENRYYDSGKKLAASAGEQGEIVIEKVKTIVASILEFFWHANLKLRSGKIKRFLEVFSSTVNEKYEIVVNQYKLLRENVDDAFQGEVVKWLNVIKDDNAKLAAEMRRDNAAFVEGLLFPALDDIRSKLGNIQSDVKEMAMTVQDIKDEMTEEKAREKFKGYYDRLKPTDTHYRILDETLEPLRRTRGTKHLSKWLFTHEHYQIWETGPPQLALINTVMMPVMMSGFGTQPLPENKEMSDTAQEKQETNVTPNVFYLKGRAGFGKSVTMAVAIERILGQSKDDITDHNRLSGPHYHRRSTGSVPTIAQIAPGSPVLFFFFKTGDDMTQLSARAWSSLVAQLFNEGRNLSKETMTKFCTIAEAYLKAQVKEAEHDREEGLTESQKLEAKKDRDGSETTVDIKSDTNQTTSGSAATEKDKDKEKETPKVAKLEGALLLLESLAEAIGNTVYIIIDGLDECSDLTEKKFVTDIRKLAQSKIGKFKLLLSSRENLGLEELFADDEEGKQKFRPPIDESEEEQTESGPLLCVTHGDTTMLTVNKDTNSEDMKAYLDHSLRQIMRRRTQNEAEETALDIEINGIVDRIQGKADGMFTYSAMVITSLDQPSRLSLSQRLEKLPTKMNTLYSRQLESLSGAQRDLVVLALRRIVWSPDAIGTLEVIEEFKRVYRKRNLKKKNVEAEEEEEDQTDDDEPHESPTEKTNGHTEDKKGLVKPDQDSRTWKDFSDKIGEELKDPEIIDTIYHLEVAGRNFFKFSNAKRNIDVIHKSVRDWVIDESKKSAEKDKYLPPIDELFTWDRSGRLKLTMPIPGRFIRGRADATIFASEKEAHLEILIYHLQVLTNPVFQEKYMNVDSFEELPSRQGNEEPPKLTNGEASDVTKEKESGASEHKETDEKPENTPNINGDKPSEDSPNVETVDSQNDSAGGNEADASTTEPKNGAPISSTSIDQVENGVNATESESKKTADESPTETLDSKNTEKDSASIVLEQQGGLEASQPNEPESEQSQSDAKLQDTESKEPTEDLLVDALEPEKPRTEPTPPGTEGEKSEAEPAPAESEPEKPQSESTPAEPEPKPENSEAEPISTDLEETEPESDVSPPEFIRCEIYHWRYHMKRLAALWPREERWKGDKWEKLKYLLKIFTELRTFNRWMCQYDRYRGVSFKEATSSNYRPGHIAAGYDLELYFEFLLYHYEYDWNQWSRLRRNVLHMERLLSWPNLVEAVLDKGIDFYNRDNKGVGVFQRFMSYLVGARDSEDKPKLLETAKLFLKYDIDFTETVPDTGIEDDRVLHCTPCIANEELVTLILAKMDKKDLSLTDAHGRTALHIAFVDETTPEMQTKIARMFLEAGAMPDAEDDRSKTPLRRAVEAENESGVALLLEPKWGVNIDDEDIDGATALIAAAGKTDFTSEEKRASNLNIIKQLIAAGANLEARTKSGLTVLMEAFFKKNNEIAEEILAIHKSKTPDSNAYLMQKDIYGRTLLHFVVRLMTDEIRFTELVLNQLNDKERAEALDATYSEDNSTALIVAVDADKWELSSKLLEAGSNIHALTWMATSCLRLAIDSYSEDAGELYKAFMKLVFSKTPTPFHEAIARNWPLLIEWLGVSEADLFRVDDENWDALDWAYTTGRQELLAPYKIEERIELEYTSRKSEWEKRFEQKWEWDSKRMRDDVVLSEDKLTSTLEHDKGNEDYLLITTHPLAPYASRYYFEVKFLSAVDPDRAILGVGFSTDEPRNNEWPGWDTTVRLSFAIHGDEGHIFSPRIPKREDNNENYKDLEIGPVRFSVGDVVGAGYDQVKHQIFFTVNGQYIGVGFEDVRERLWPVLCMRAQMSTQVNFGTDPDVPFMWNGEEIAALPETSVTRKAAEEAEEAAKNKSEEDDNSTADVVTANGIIDGNVNGSTVDVEVVTYSDITVEESTGAEKGEKAEQLSEATAGGETTVEAAKSSDIPSTVTTTIIGESEIKTQISMPT